MQSFSRRVLLRQSLYLCSMLGGALLAGCRTPKETPSRERIVPIERPVTRIVTEVVRETILVEATPRVIERIVTPAPSPPITLTADVLDASWSHFGQSVTPLFEEMFPGLRLRWRSLSDWVTYPQRIAALSASGQLGDLIELPTRTLTLRWARQRILQDLGPLLEASHYETSGLLPSGIANYQWEKRQLGLPLLCHGGAHILLYDKSKLESAGIPSLSEVKDLETLFNLLETLSNPIEDLYGAGVSWELPDAYPLLRAFGTDLFDATGQKSTLYGTAGAAFLTWLYQLQARGAAPSPVIAERGLISMWQKGRLGILVTTLWRATELISLQPERSLGMAPLPPIKGNASLPAIATGTGYGIPVSSRNAPQALQWIAFMLTQEMGVRMFLEGFGGLGSRRAAWEDSRVLERLPACAQFAPIVAQAEIEHVPIDLHTERYYALWNHHVRRMLEGLASPEQTLTALTAEIENLLFEKISPDVHYQP